MSTQQCNYNQRRQHILSLFMSCASMFDFLYDFADNRMQTVDSQNQTAFQCLDLISKRQKNAKRMSQIIRTSDKQKNMKLKNRLLTMISFEDFPQTDKLKNFKNILFRLLWHRKRTRKKNIEIKMNGIDSCYVMKYTWRIQVCGRRLFHFFFLSFFSCSFILSFVLFDAIVARMRRAIVKVNCAKANRQQQQRNSKRQN